MGFEGFLLRDDDQQRCQVLGVEDEVLLLHQIGQVTGQQASAAENTENLKKFLRFLAIFHSRLLLLQILQISLQAVVSLRLCLQVRVNLPDLLRDDVGDVAKRLLDGILCHVPLEASNVLRQFRWKIERKLVEGTGVDWVH